MEVLHQNTILCGDADWLCLVCEEHSTAAEQAHVHILTPQHKTKLSGNRYLENFAEDRIRKISSSKIIQNILYCECCDVTLASTRRAVLHVATDIHGVNKQLTPKMFPATHLARSGDFVVAFDEVFIGVEAWNGITGGCCALCDTEAQEVSGHIEETAHILKLIATRTRSGFARELFRKIDDGLLHCLTCNETLPQTEFIGHMDSQSHDLLYTKCRRGEMLVAEQPKSDITHLAETNVSTIDNEPNSKSDTKLLSQKDLAYAGEPNDTQSSPRVEKLTEAKNVHDSEAENSTSNLAAETEQLPSARVEKVKDSKKVDKSVAKHSTSNLLAAETEQLPSPRVEKVKDSKKVDKSVANHSTSNLLAAETEQLLSPRVEKVKDSKKVDKSVAKHSTNNLAETAHNPVKREADNTKPTRISLKLLRAKLVTTRRYVRSGVNLLELDKIVINESVFLSLMSFNRFKNLERKFAIKCEICKVSMRNQDNHVNNSRHINNVLSLEVLDFDESEFIRKIPPNCYHCGICHSVIPDSQGLREHLTSQQHLSNKEIAQADLRKWLPSVRGHLQALSPFDGPITGLHLSAPEGHRSSRHVPTADGMAQLYFES